MRHLTSPQLESESYPEFRKLNVTNVEDESNQIMAVNNATRQLVWHLIGSQQPAVIERSEEDNEPINRFIITTISPGRFILPSKLSPKW